MRTQSRDTSEEIERILIRGHQQFSPAKKFAILRSMTHTMAEANRHHLPVAENERDERFVASHYGPAYAAALCAQSPPVAVVGFDLLLTLERIVPLLIEQHIPLALSGSLACCLYGFPRTCRDIDLLVDAQEIADFDAWSSTLIRIDDKSTLDGYPLPLRWLDPQTLIKVELCAAPPGFSSAQLLHRASSLTLVENGLALHVLSAEDVILTRLQWYVATGAIADDQWNDLMGIVKVQAPHLDASYLSIQAQTLRLAHLLAQLFLDADFGGFADVTADEPATHSTNSASSH